MPKILLVEDEAATRELIGDTLRRENMHVEAVEGCETVLGYLDGGAFKFDLLLLDNDLSAMDGFSFCRELRAKTRVPIVMLSGRDDEASIVVGLEVGADDYLIKPFNVRELTSRVRAHLRRQRWNIRTSEEEVIEFPGLKIDMPRHKVRANGNPVELSAAQFKILTLLASHPSRVYSREQIMEPIWGNGLSSGSRAADVHIQNIRRKIEVEPANPRYILTVRGAGYCFADYEGSSAAGDPGLAVRAAKMR
ncbi:MAG: response regulator transcription factor [Rubrobacteraceae bacterium]